MGFKLVGGKAGVKRSGEHGTYQNRDHRSGIEI